MSQIDEKWVRDEIKRQLNIILNASAGENTTSTETINQLFPGMPGITARPVMHPYGFVSRAVKGIISVTAKIGDHFGNRLVLGHRDKDRPTNLDEGESAVYSMGGYTIRMKNGKIELGKGEDYEVAVVGDTMVEFLTLLLDHIIAHTHICSVPGAQGAPPLNVADFQDDKANFIANEKILAKDGGRF